ncbi:MAG TPA: oligoribonuclease [Patescibacteria group bacterium]|nr:oligoribonuclease [Patescibacteria group bacterium]
MSDTKDVVPTKILWVDLEMTGLDPVKDVILEIAAEITDFNFKTLESYEAKVQHKRDLVAERMQKNVWWKDFPANRDEFLNNLGNAKPSGEVEQDLIALVNKHFGQEPAVLGGNSIYNDRMFVKQWWPALDLKLHYRMLDVSAWKVFMQGKYGVKYEKKQIHRAFDDIQASIAELQHYLDWFKENGPQNS